MNKIRSIRIQEALDSKIRNGGGGGGGQSREAKVHLCHLFTKYHVEKNFCGF